MFKLFINDKPAVIKGGSSFKFTLNNNAFDSTSGNKTYDVTLPLAGCAENVAIFGTFLHLPFVGKEEFGKKQYAFSLYGDHIHISGAAYLTKVTEEEATVQLLCDMSAFRNISNAANVYVDEMNLGMFWDGLRGEMPPINLGDEENETSDYVTPWENYRELEQYVSGNIYQKHVPLGGTRAVDYLLGFKREAAIVPFAGGYTLTDGVAEYEQGNVVNYNTDTQRFVIKGKNVCPAPYLLNVLKRICACMGYEFSSAGLPQESFIHDVVILHRFRTIHVADALPHCTLKEFLSAIENALGVYFYASGKTVHLVSLAAKYPSSGAEGAVELSEVVDEEETSIDKDEEPKSILQQNTMYDFPDCDERLCLPDDAWEKGNVLTFPSYAALSAAASKLDKAERNNCRNIYVDTSTGRVYVYLHVKGWKGRTNYNYTYLYNYALVEVDQAGRHLSDYADPTNVTKITATPPFMLRDGSKILPWMSEEIAFLESETIDSLINPEDNEDYDDLTFATKEDSAAFYMVVFGTAASTSGPDLAPVGIGLPYDINADTGFPYKISGITNKNQDYTDEVFNLKKSANGSIGSTLAAVIGVGHRAVHCIKFTDKIDCDPGALYLIKGRRYLCQKLEITFDEDGVQPLKTGYFFEVEE